MSFFKKLKEKITQQTDSVSGKFKEGLAKTRNTFQERVNELVSRYRKVDEDFFEELEEVLIGADVGVATVMELIDELKSEVKRRNIQDPKEVQSVISEKLVEIYEGGEQEASELRVEDGRLNIILFVGVNGVGKTTTIGKLAHQFIKEGKNVVLAAGDTFRAGAIDQLKCGESASARMSSNRRKARILRLLSMTPFKPRKRAAPMSCFATRQDACKIK